MAQAIVTLKVTPRELQYIRVALGCYINSIQAHDYSHVDLSPAENDPGTAATCAHNIVRDIGMK